MGEQELAQVNTHTHTHTEHNVVKAAQAKGSKTLSKERFHPEKLKMFMTPNFYE